ncbi:hypothetical protein HLK66_25935 (plasmid) [Niallia circulans]|uniref:hypothetical protein n=1 Tax=Niallia circulans TaxID=1397 RepID=UPI00149070A3|nr:hypothetical protein [Niallia circulans]QJX65125.1 hypothetical protein HLK66_25935 [Niallia circulans]
MNKNQNIVFEYLKEQHFQNSVIEIDGDYESIPDNIYAAYYKLNYKEKLQVFKKVINYQLKNQSQQVLLSDD